MFGLGVEVGFEIPHIIIVTFEINNVNTQPNDVIIFRDMDVTEGYCKISSVSYPEDRMTNNYGTINYNKLYKETISFNRNYNGILDGFKPYINHRTLKILAEYIFDNKYQREHIGA